MTKIRLLVPMLALLLIVTSCTPASPTTVLFVNPFTGADTNLGSQASPLATLTEALSRATTGWTIFLANGTYSESSGETWPLQTGFPPSAAHNVPTGVTVAGLGNGAVLAGPGGATTAAALVFAGAATVKGIEIHSFERALLASQPGELVLEDLNVHGNSIDGLLAYGTAAVKVQGSSFNHNGLSGVAAFGTAALELRDIVLDHNRTGLYATDQATVHVSGGSISGNGSQNDFSHSGVYAIGAANLELYDLILSFNYVAGIEVWDDVSMTIGLLTITGSNVGLFAGDAPGALEVVMTQSELIDNIFGINWYGPALSRLSVRQSQIHQSAYGVGVYGDPIVFDFGTGASQGENLISTYLYERIYDARSPRLAADGPILTFSASDVVPDTPGCAGFLSTAIYVGPASISCDGVEVLFISSLNNRVQFSGN